jgi:hypothetical protein
MAKPIQVDQDINAMPAPARRAGTIAAAGAAALAAVLLLTALALWFRYGTAVFFDMVAAGIAACF